MQQPNFRRTVVAGLAATAAMTMLMLIAPLMGMPEMNIGAMLGSMLGVSLAAGWAIHVMMGVLLAVSYVQFAVPRLPGTGWKQGALFALIPFVMKEAVVGPVMGAGVFESAMQSSALLVMGGLIGHLLYGVVLGAIAGTPRVVVPPVRA